jgi:hypothetical protein
MNDQRYNTGFHAWTHGEPCYLRGKDWQGNAISKYLGPCPDCGAPTHTYGSSWACVNDFCGKHVSRIVCNNGPRPEWWNTEINVFKDGDAWCATGAGFINLQESDAGFGRTPQAAVQQLREAAAKLEAP